MLIGWLRFGLERGYPSRSSEGSDAKGSLVILQDQLSKARVQEFVQCGSYLLIGEVAQPESSGFGSVRYRLHSSVPVHLRIVPKPRIYYHGRKEVRSTRVDKQKASYFPRSLLKGFPS
jgi:hypothetical protein